jgi:hypothetical protein
MKWLRKYWPLLLVLAFALLIIWAAQKTRQTVAAVLSAPGAAVKAAWEAANDPNLNPVAGAAEWWGEATSDWHPLKWFGW